KRHSRPPVFWKRCTATLPPLLPEQLQLQGPLPEMFEAVPVEQRLVVGVLLRLCPFDEPQAPLTATAFSGAEHCAAVPPFVLAQLQLQGPLPEIIELLPALQKPVVGAVLTATPLAVPHAPLIIAGARQTAIVPPLLPIQFHDHGPLPFTFEAVPALQRLAVGVL